MFGIGKTRAAIPFVFSYFMRTFERAENDILMKLFPWESSRGLYWKKQFSSLEVIVVAVGILSLKFLRSDW